MRLFLAAEMDRAARDQCASHVTALRRAIGDADAALRWTPAENVHMTLHFLGDADRTSADRLTAELTSAIRPSSFDARTSSFGVFPPGGPPKILWLGIGDGAAEFTRLHASLSEPVRRAGFQVETRPFSPHLTIARVRERERASVRGLRAQLAAISPAPIEWRVDHVTLFQSDLSGPTPRYVPITVLPLS